MSPITFTTNHLAVYVNEGVPAIVNIDGVSGDVEGKLTWVLFDNDINEFDDATDANNFVGIVRCSTDEWCDAQHGIYSDRVSELAGRLLEAAHPEPPSPNLDNSFSREALKTLLENCDDAAASHVLWVDKSGGVHVSPLPPGVRPNQLPEREESLQLRFETFHRSGGYVGDRAASSEDWVNRLYTALLAEWPEARDSPVPKYCDNF